MTRRPSLAVVSDPSSEDDGTGADTELSVSALVDRLYTRHRDLVYRVASRMSGGDRAFAEDITQDVFITLFRHARSVSTMDKPEAWFYRVTTNRCINRLRRERFLGLAPVRWLLGERVPRPLDPETMGITEDLLRRAFGRVMKMPPKARACFFMHHVDGKSQVEIAALLGHSKGYVSKLISRCERVLIELIDEEGTS